MNKWIFVGLSLWTSLLFAQNSDSLIRVEIPMLNEIVLSDDKLDQWAVGTSVLSLDSALSYSQGQDLSSLLSSSSHIRIRNYGALATSSIRGAGASHTQVVWNGLSLNNPMHGQYDLSLIPVFFIENIRVQSGALSSLLGDGAIGGSIHLNRVRAFDKGTSALLYTGIGSFGKRSLGYKTQISRANFVWDIAFYQDESKNDFSFSDPYNPRLMKNQEHAAQFSRSLQSSLSKRFGDYLIADLIYWYQESERLIPPTLFEGQSTAEQEDRAHRWVLKTHYKREYKEWNTQVSFSSDRLIFVDSLKDIDSNHNTEQFVVNQDFQWILNATSLLRIENMVQHQRIYSENIKAGDNRETRYGLIANYRKEIGDSGVLILSAREELLGSKWSPLLPTLAYKHIFADVGILEGSISRSFRRPTWNDRYWSPGGNPDLRSEKGMMANLSFEKIFNKSILQKQFKLSTYYGRISDWIIWLPEAAYWTPKNLALVEQKGVELEAALTYSSRWGAFKYQNMFSIQSSTNIGERVPGDEAQGKQLIYVPLYQVNQNISWSKDSWEIYFRHHFESKRFTTDDHSDHLLAYQLGDFGVQKQIYLGSTKLKAGLQLANIWNEEYQLVQGRPMPGRSIQVNMNLYL